MLTLGTLQAACIAADGVPPFNDQAVIEAERGERVLLHAAGEPDAGAALVPAFAGQAGVPVEIEFAVLPDRRATGVGTAIARLLIERYPDFTVWAHGELPAAQRIAAAFGMQRVRTLLRLERPLEMASAAAAQATMRALTAHGIRTFRAADAEAWLLLYAAAFAHHPEQGSLTATDLATRRASEWHDDANLFILERDGRLLGYAWLKPDGDRCELYALGVDPSAQGGGFGRLLLDTAIARMQQLGAHTAELYVEGDNERAVTLYERAGFQRAAVDTMFRHQEFTPR